MTESDGHTPDAATPPEGEPPPVVESSTTEPPPTTVEPSPLPTTVAPTGQLGPVGKPRSVFFVIVMSLITLGIYHLYWTYKVFDEMKRHTQTGIGGVLGLVIAIIINPVNWFVMPSEVGNMYQADGRDKPMTGWTGLWNLLLIIGWFVWTVKIQNALNRYWASKLAVAT